MHDLEEFHSVCRLDELKEQSGRSYFVNDVEIAVFRVGETVYALDNICPHQHVPLIYDGIIEDDCVVCPAHGWKFDLKTGKLGGCRRGLTPYEVKVSEGMVYVKAEKKLPAW